MYLPLWKVPTSIKSGIDDLVAGITALQDNISFSAYKATMLQNGLEIDGLRLLTQRRHPVVWQLHLSGHVPHNYTVKFPLIIKFLSRRMDCHGITRIIHLLRGNRPEIIYLIIKDCQFLRINFGEICG